MSATLISPRILFSTVVGPKLGMFAWVFATPLLYVLSMRFRPIHESTPHFNPLVRQPETNLNRLDTSVHEMVRTAVKDGLLDQFHLHSGH